MARVWGAWGTKSGTNQRFRVGADYTRSGSTVTVQNFLLQAEMPIAQNNLNLTRSGSFSGSFTASATSAGVNVLGGGQSRTGSPGGTVTIGIATTNIYNGNDVSMSAAISIPVSSPSAPSTPSVSRSSDSRHVVSWSRNATSQAPYSSQRVERRVYNGSWGSWSAVSPKLSGTATSWTDTSTVANRSYEYRVRATNASGSAVSGVSVTQRTTPSAPRDVKAQKLSNGDIRVSFTPTQVYATSVSFYVEGRAGSGSWSQLGTTGSSPFTHSSPNPAQAWTYRVRARVTSPNSLYSAYSAVSNSVALLGKPNPPTLVAPTGVVDRDEQVTFEWVHEPVDTTEQTAYGLRYRINGGGWTTLTGTTASTRTIAALGVSGTVEWQVWTRGDHPTQSDWSAVGSFTLGATPSVTINSPDPGILAESVATVEVGYFQVDDLAQTHLIIELIHDEQVIESRSLGSATSGVFQTPLDDDETYTITAIVRASNGLWSEVDSVTFTTEFPEPFPVIVSGEWDRETGSVTLGFTVDGLEATYEWTGTPGESASEMIADGQVVARNLIHNGSFEYVDSNAATVGWEAQGLDPQVFDLPTNGFPHDFFFAPYGGVVGDNVFFVYQFGSGPVPACWSAPFPVSPGEWVGYGGLVAVEGAQDKARIVVRFLDSASNQLGSLVGSPYEDAPVYDGAQFLGAVEAPAGAAYAQIWIDAPPVESGQNSFYADAVRADVAASEQEALQRVASYFDGDTQAQAPISHLTVERRDTPDSPWVTIARDVILGESVVDRTPIVGSPEYRAISHTELPSSRVGPPTVVEWQHTGEDPVFVNAGPGFAVVGRAFGKQASNDMAVDSDRVAFAGFDKPLAFFGDGSDETVSFTGLIHKVPVREWQVTTRDEWRKILHLRDVVCYRDCQGRKHFGILAISFAQDGPVETVNISVAEVWHLEGVEA